MRNLVLIQRFECLAGTTIQSAIREAWEIVNRPGAETSVVFDFNGIDVSVYRYQSVEDIEEEFHRNIKKKSRPFIPYVNQQGVDTASHDQEIREQERMRVCTAIAQYDWQFSNFYDEATKERRYAMLIRLSKKK